MIVGQNALLNKYVPTFFIKNIAEGQTLVYDSTRKAFINADASGGGTGATKLGQLTDVNPSVDNPLSTQEGQNVLLLKSHSLVKINLSQFSVAIG